MYSQPATARWPRAAATPLAPHTTSPAIVIDVVHPGVRATGSSVLALFQNLFGLAAGPFLTGVLSDALGLQNALTLIPAFGALAAIFFLLAARNYENDMQRVRAVPVDTAAPGGAAAQGAAA